MTFDLRWMESLQKYAPRFITNVKFSTVSQSTTKCVHTDSIILVVHVYIIVVAVLLLAMYIGTSNSPSLTILDWHWHNMSPSFFIIYKLHELNWQLVALVAMGREPTVERWTFFFSF